MRRAILLSLAFIAAATLTLGPKLRDYRAADRPDVTRLHRDLARSLSMQGYRTRIARSQRTLRYVVAESGGCRFAVTRTHAGGGNIAPFIQLNEVGGTQRFYHAGKWAQSPPEFRLLIDSLLLRYAGAIGLAYDYPPVLVFSVPGSSCALDRLALAGIRLHPVRQMRGAEDPEINE